MPPSPDDTAQFLAGSRDRLRLLTSLSEAPAAPADLADALSIPRRSVQRHLREFVDRGWAETPAGAGTYRLTVTGRLVTDEHASYRDALERIEAFDPFFRRVPDRTHAPDPKWLETATLTTADADDPQAPIHHYVSSVRAVEGDHVRMLSPVLSRLFHDVHAELALAGVHTDLVMDADTIERARELNPLEFEVVVGLDVLDLYRHPTDVAVGLTLGEDRVLLGGYDDDGQLKSCLESSNPACLEWADGLFERYRDRADRVRSSGPGAFLGRDR